MSSPKGALVNSPLNKLPPEVRSIVYCFLITQPYEILISYKFFKTRFEEHGLFPDICMHCSRGQALCKCNDFTLSHEFYYQKLPQLTISTAILSTCHLIYDEAAPLFYKKNSFHFADPTAIERFQVATDRKHNHKVENLIFTIHSAHREVHYRWEKALNGRKSLDLAECFPNLKSVVIKLRGQYELLSNADLDKFCTAMVQKLRPCHELEWVHISGLIDPGAVMGFAPAIERLKSSDVDDKEAQIDITTCWSRNGWTNATIWWGRRGERTPYMPPFQSFDLRVKRVFQRALLSGSKPTAADVAVPNVDGVGGTIGAWAFM